MEASNLKKAGLLAIVLAVLFVLCYEFYWRSKGFGITYNDDESLWSVWRKEIYKPSNIVFIGSSRIKYDLDIPTWEKITGENAIQLSMAGTSPRPILDELARDNNFNGKLIIDVTEGVFFGRNTKQREKSAIDAIEFYKKWTPAQKFSSYVNYMLESGFVFLEKSKFSLNSLLNELPYSKRKGLIERPAFPRKFNLNTFKRQSFMHNDFLNDTSMQHKQIKNWAINGNLDKKQGIRGDSLHTIFRQVKSSIDKIKARGGQVLFVRTPSSGAYLNAEKFNYPRQMYWDSLLTFTNCTGIHFEDYPSIANFQCPELSHLSLQDAVIFTKYFINILVEKGWTFPNIKFIN